MSANVFHAAVDRNAFQSLFMSLTAEQKITFAKTFPETLPPKLEPSDATPTKKKMDSEPEVTNTGSFSVENAIRARERQAQAEAKARARKRSTNSFITFRAYYTPLLRGLTQKAKSGLIRKMWAAEPRKHFFALLAKAHSELRKNHSELIEFEKFLSSTVGLLPIIKADTYLKAMGWELITSANGGKELLRSSILPDQLLPLTTNLSARDIVEHCYKIGLVARPVPFSRTTHTQVLSMESAMSMPFAAAPNSSTLSGGVKYIIVSEGRQQTDPEIRERIDAEVSNSTSQTRTFDFNDLETGYRPSIQVVTADQQQAFDRYPFAVHFHPDAPTVVGFDPKMSQDKFDPFSFDLSEYVDFDL